MLVYRRPEIIEAHFVGYNTAGWAQRSSSFKSLFGKSPDDGPWQLHRAIVGHETAEIRAFAQKLSGPPDHLSGSDAVSKQDLNARRSTSQRFNLTNTGQTLASRTFRADGCCKMVLTTVRAGQAVAPSIRLSGQIRYA